MITSSLILDLIFVLIVVYTTVMGVKRGFFRTIMELATYLVSFVGAIFASRMITPMLLSWVRPTLSDWIDESVTAYLGDAEIKSVWIGDIIDHLVEGGTIDTVADTAATVLVDTVLYTIVSVILGILLFFLINLVLKLLIRGFDAMMKLPVLKQFNKLGGLLIGVFNGLLLIALLLWLQKTTGVISTNEAYEASFLVPYLTTFLPI